MSRVALNAPDQVFRLGSSSITGKHETGMATITYRTLKLQYAIQVWLRVLAISKNNPGSLLFYWWLNWKDCSNGFRTLVYSDSLKYYDVDQEKLLAEFLNRLQQVADSGEIRVHEYCYSNLETSCVDFCDTCKPSYEVVVDAPDAKDICERIGPVADYDYNKAEVTYSWNDIKDYFTVLTLNQLRLVNNKGLHKQSLWDKVLFKGAEDCNISMMQYAIDNGANTQSLDSSGESALVRAVSNARFPNSVCDAGEIIGTIDFLLSKGADIDAFGFDGIPPLMEAYYGNSPDLVRFLIERGANVNFNCYLMDCQSWQTLKQIKSTLMYEMETSYDFDYSPEIEEIVRAAGGLSSFADMD